MKVINYLKDVRGEMQHVSWPTTRQTGYFSALVITVSIAVAYYLGLFDFIFTSLLDAFIV